MSQRHRCPWWMGCVLASPVRRFVHNPRRILAPHVKPGMTVLDLGCGMGTFTLDLARLVAPDGRVIAMDVEPRMLKGIERRAGRAGLRGRIELLLASDEASWPKGEASWSKGLEGKVDFALAFYMVHEVDDALGLLGLVRSTLAPGGTLLLVEPKMHVSACDYADTVAAARKAGFDIVDHPSIRLSRAVLLAPR